MEALILRNNSLSGQLPSSLKNCSNKLALLDLGENKFHGPLPSWIGDSLQNLEILSLRSNNFYGSLPSNLCYLTKLQVLDLSLNNISGRIPTCRIPSSIARIDRLAMLDLSNNQLCGNIPIGTQLQSFNASSFEGNSNLCGEPLDRKCPEEDPSKHQVPTTDAGDDDNSIFLEALYMSMGIGFFTGFVGLVGSMLLLPSWRETYSRFLNTLILKVIMWWKQ
ncbi:receptor-like protein EIX1 [Medicago truncatula]|uniref:receptor-like protein EIX1 n=1 Tax=Medicago truncatula TaxID=3880 RepID=UPI000D2F32A8|nr:receptor-like protein EIX1 [Medicago truncatula]